MDILQEFWNITGVPEPMFDCEKAPFDKWKTIDGLYEGTRNSHTNIKHGYVRETWLPLNQNSLGKMNLFESTYLFNHKNGIYRQIYDNKVTVRLYIDDKPEAQMAFKFDFTEIRKMRSGNYEKLPSPDFWRLT